MNWPQDIKGIRLLGLLFPPAGTIALWQSPNIPRPTKVLGTLWLGFFTIIYAALWSGLALWALVSTGTLQTEWRGGSYPSFTRTPTLPDYAAVEAHRAAQAQQPPVAVTNQNHPKPYWTDFRGPYRDSHYDEQPVLANWPANGPKLLWRQPCGGGYASFVVADGRAFTIEQRRRTNETVVAYDLGTGRELWAHYYYGLFTESMGGDGPRATPTFYKGKIYAQGALGQLNCLEAATGKLLWSTNILINNGASLPAYGTTASPLVVDDKVIVTPGGPGGRSVVAYDAATSAPVWKAFDDRAAYSSPMLTSLAGQREVVVVTATRALALNPADGKLLWEYPWVIQSDYRNIPQPVWVNVNHLFLSAGQGVGGALLEITKDGTNFFANAVWQNKSLKSKFVSAVLCDGYLYGLDEGVLVCLDAMTGERKWKKGHYGYGQLLVANGYLVILCGNGDLALLRADPERRQEIARVPALHGKTWNCPAIAGGKLLVRNAVEMACFDLRPGQ